MAELLKLQVVTPERKVVEAEADGVELPGAEGYLGILPGHTPLITLLKPGVLSYKRGGAATGATAVCAAVSYSRTADCSQSGALPGSSSSGPGIHSAALSCVASGSRMPALYSVPKIRCSRASAWPSGTPRATYEPTSRRSLTTSFTCSRMTRRRWSSTGLLPGSAARIRPGRPCAPGCRGARGRVIR